MIASEFAQDYFKGISPIKIFRMHYKGFSAEDWMVSSIKGDECHKYLTTVKYYDMHPLNGQFSKWIDDKLTLKYLCAGTKLDKYMPEYYYEISDCGTINKLPDNVSEGKPVVDDIIVLLHEKHNLAFKLVAAQIGVGFYKVEYNNGEYFVNGEKFSEGKIKEFILSLRGYIITEYFHSHKDLARLSPQTANPIRVTVGRLNGKFEKIITFLRLGTKSSGFVENYAAGGILTFINDRGGYLGGHIFDFATGQDIMIEKHCDSDVLIKGQIPMWEEILKSVDDFAEYFPQLSYCGFDFVVTSDNKVKILEINSLPSLDALQINGTILKGKPGEFFAQ